MDLVVNAPVKAALRKARTECLFQCFSRWKIERLEAIVNKKPLPPFNPPKPKVADGIKSLFACNDETFAAESFRESMKKCFVDVCIAPSEIDSEHVHFKGYKEHKHGSMHPNPHFSRYDMEHELGSVGMAIDSLHGVSIETLTEATNADLSDDGEDDGESGSDEDEDA